MYILNKILQGVDAMENKEQKPEFISSLRKLAAKGAGVPYDMIDSIGTIVDMQKFSQEIKRVYLSDIFVSHGELRSTYGKILSQIKIGTWSNMFAVLKEKDVICVINDVYSCLFMPDLAIVSMLYRVALRTYESTYKHDIVFVSDVVTKFKQFKKWESVILNMLMPNFPLTIYKWEIPHWKNNMTSITTYEPKDVCNIHQIIR